MRCPTALMRCPTVIVVKSLPSGHFQRWIYVEKALKTVRIFRRSSKKRFEVSIFQRLFIRLQKTSKKRWKFGGEISTLIHRRNFVCARWVSTSRFQFLLYCILIPIDFVCTASQSATSVLTNSINYNFAIWRTYYFIFPGLLVVLFSFPMKPNWLQRFVVFFEIIMVNWTKQHEGQTLTRPFLGGEFKTHGCKFLWSTLQRFTERCTENIQILGLHDFRFFASRLVGTK